VSFPQKMPNMRVCGSTSADLGLAMPKSVSGALFFEELKYFTVTVNIHWQLHPTMGDRRSGCEKGEESWQSLLTSSCGLRMSRLQLH